MSWLKETTTAFLVIFLAGMLFLVMAVLAGSTTPAHSQAIEPTCADFLYARAARLSMAGYDARIMVGLVHVNQAALGNARTVAKEAAGFCQGNPGLLYDDVVKEIIDSHVAQNN